MTTTQGGPAAAARNVDAVVIGAGFAGLYAVHRLREMGLSVQGFERGSGVGGTWYWNRYPGAGSDSESWVYSYTFSSELEQEWTWSSRFPPQSEILRYLQHVAERFDLNRSFQFHTAVNGASYDEASNRWLVKTDKGDTLAASYLITAVGCLSAAAVPNIAGRDDFKGRWYHTGEWPHEGVDFSDKRVGVIGTGSSGIQAIPVIARQAKHLTVFQRTPNFSVPARNRALTPEEVANLKRNIKEIREFCRWSTIGQPYDFQNQNALDLDADTLRQQLEANWRKGGFEWMFGGFPDMLYDQRANDIAADFVREKIRQTVKDPKLAEKLIPAGYPIATKRLPLDSGYFETFNRDNVTLVDLRDTPIERIVADGVRTSDKTHELDIIVFATGFDALTGPLTRVGIRGRQGRKLEDKWAEGPRTYLGVASEGFPNLFMITGPGSPSVLGNMPTSIEQHVDWVCGLIAHLRGQGAAHAEPTTQAEDNWSQHVQELADATLFPQADSWYLGANIPGKPRVFLPYIGGFGTYRKLCNEVADKGYEGFAIA
ncbi:MAG: NAD(P)/FAD-dependent oxidoreductase [Proteobacteria bacterium]|jgi:cyclohexanone monooxygenase|nr:NAD(P)/FAD-dependent oxidoreductase [Pseudomonadota bacterium]